MNETNISSKLDAYLTEIGKYPLLSIEKEVELAAKIQNGDEDALRLLVDRNRRFVVSVARAYLRRGKSLEELITAGNGGLETAARNFLPDTDVKFIAYAVWYIRQSMEEILKPHEEN